MCIPYWFIIVGYVIAISTMSVPGRYVSMFLMAGGSAGTHLALTQTEYSPLTDRNTSQGHALLLVWLANAVPRPPSKRSAAIAVVNACGNIGTM